MKTLAQEITLEANELARLGACPKAKAARIAKFVETDEGAAEIQSLWDNGMGIRDITDLLQAIVG